MYSLTWLSSVLKGAGLKVIEEAGWQARGHGDVSEIKGVLCHHTAGPRSGDHPSLGTVVQGRPGLAGPLAQLFLSRDGTYYVVCAGKAWHAGAGKWQGITDGNGHFIGIEAENTGLRNNTPWPAVQIDAYHRGVAALLKKINAPVIMCAGHKEYALPKGRKSDPDFDMTAFRSAVSLLMGSSVKLKVTGVKPSTLNLRDRPNGNILARLPEGTVVTSLDQSGSWTQVLTAANLKGWVASSYLS